MTRQTDPCRADPGACSGSFRGFWDLVPVGKPDDWVLFALVCQPACNTLAVIHEKPASVAAGRELS